MTRLRALEIEAHALSTMTGPTDEQPPALSGDHDSAPPSPAPGRVQAVALWVAIALGAALNLVLCLPQGSSGPL